VNCRLLYSISWYYEKDKRPSLLFDSNTLMNSGSIKLSDTLSDGGFLHYFYLSVIISS